MKCLATTENLDVIAVTETFIETSNIDFILEYDTDASTLSNKDHGNRRGWGVSFYVINYLPTDRTPPESNVDELYVGININVFQLSISVTYKPPEQSCEVDARLYSILLQTLCNAESLILGDINLP